jgi:hypothetical protein
MGWRGANRIASIVPTIIGAIGGVLGWFTEGTTFIGFCRWSGLVNTVWLASGSFIFVWFMWCIGYAFAKTRSRELIFGVLLFEEQSLMNSHGDLVRGRVSYAGMGEVKSKVYLVGLANGLGESIGIPGGGYPLLHEETLSEDGLPMTTFKVFAQQGGWLYICSIPSRVELFNPHVSTRPLKLRFRLRATAERCSPVEEDYWLERAPDGHYRPSQSS